MKKICLSLLAFTIYFCLLSSSFARDFISIKDGHFVKKGKSYFFMGANFWQGMNLGAPAPLGNKAQLIRELDRMKKIGITQLRILALSEGPQTEPYRIIPAVVETPNTLNESLLKGLDFLLSEMKKRDMTAVICLSNFWPWSGGFAQWVSWFEGSSIPYPPPHPGGDWGVFQEYSSKFYTLPEAVKAQQAQVKKIITRYNSISKTNYVNDPTIMAWELANEPRGGKYRQEFLAWIKSSADLIKSLDKNHLVTIGSEGETMNPKDAGNDFAIDHAISSIDYSTIHIWVENWGVYNPLDSLTTMPLAINLMKNYIADHVIKAKLFKKPLVLEEFGMARDMRSMDPKSSTHDRDTYYEETFRQTLFQMLDGGAITGVNFWAWSGEARPRFPYGGLWQSGDDFLGDPPHEEQGWYGVYDTDVSTLEVVSNYAKQIQQLAKRTKVSK
jgi:mannan endo-1,4-beta-mannosidase